MGVFLFTDIEGSTRLWVDQPGEMGAALAEHDELLYASAGENGGVVFKHTGDGICALFPSVSNAVVAAAGAQRGLAAHDWGTVGALRVRMAIHAGEAERRGDDWFGPALNRTARLMGIGHGGQVLLSDAAHALVADELTKRLSFVDLGVHRLRDLSRPERAWQLVGDGLERTFPPLRSLEGYPGHLPVQTTSFIGRQAELDQVAAELATARLVTLVGPGGVGKTRLAIQVGASLVDKFPDGVWMFELAGLNRPDGLEASMLATLGRSGTSVTIPRQELLDLVGRWQALLVVDNCEHLLLSVAEVMRDLLAAGPDLRVLATSREALHLKGERVTVVDPLPMADEAVTLFLDRAASVRRSFGAEGQNRAAIGRICQQLDGIPLAIELAAARTSAMSPTEIDRRLDRRFRLLSDRAGGRGRHASLQKAVDWSYDLLAEDQQEFFCRLAVFSGHFDAEAAHAVCGGGDEIATLDMLTGLVDKSMVNATPLKTRTSYWLLETLRQFGAAHLTETEAQRLEDRHGECFADLCERSLEGLRGRHSSDWLELLDDQFDNVRAACERALAHHDVDRAIRITGGLLMYNHIRRLPEIYGWLARALALPGAYQHRLGRHARLHRENAMSMAGDLSGSEVELRAILQEIDEADPLRPFSLCRLASSVGTSGRMDECERYSLEALECARRRGLEYDYDQAEAIWNLCILAMWRGAPDRALAQQLLEVARQLDNPKNLTRGLMVSGTAHPEPAQGAELLARARDLAAEIRDSYLQAVATAWHSVLTTTDDPLAAIRGIPDLVTHAKSTGQHLIFVYLGRDFMAPLAAVGRFDAIPILEATSQGLCLRPAAAVAAVAAAHGALGEDEYARLLARGITFSPADLEEFLLQLASEVS